MIDDSWLEAAFEDRMSHSDLMTEYWLDDQGIFDEFNDEDVTEDDDEDTEV